MATPEGARKFAIEAALMAQFQHVNITAFYGVVYTRKQDHTAHFILFNVFFSSEYGEIINAKGLLGLITQKYPY